MSLCRLRCLWLQQGSLGGQWEQRTKCQTCTFRPTFRLRLVAFCFWVFLLSMVGGWPLCRGLGEEPKMPGLDTGRLLGPLGSVKVSTDGDEWRGELLPAGAAPGVRAGTLVPKWEQEQETPNPWPAWSRVFGSASVGLGLPPALPRTWGQHLRYEWIHWNG